MSLGFDYFSPRSVVEAIDLLKEHGGQARLLAGGTNLMVQMRQRAIEPRVLVGLKKIAGLNRIEYDPRKGLTIGAMALLADVAAHPEIKAHYPAIAGAAAGTATVQIRNMGTVVGNICNASPAADNVPALLAMDAAVQVAGPSGERTLSLTDFFSGPGRTVLDGSEMVLSVTVPPPQAHTGVVYRGFSGRGRLDCTTVGIGASITLDGDTCLNSRIAVGACAPTPMRAFAAEKRLIGQRIDPATIEAVSQQVALEASPISDLRADADYRLHIIKVLTCRVIQEACHMARGRH